MFNHLRNNNVKFKSILILSAVFVSAHSSYAGNPERQGQSGVAQLTINGYAQSSGWGWANGGGVKGVEASYLNVAGMDRSDNNTEIVFSRTQWLVGSGIGVNNFGFTQKMGEGGEKGTIGISIMQFGIKDIAITTEQNPDGGIGTYRINMTNIGIGYSKSFSRNISAGIMVRAVSEGIPDAKASGVSMDAGVQYATTMRPIAGGIKRDDLKFGISLKNIGPDLKFAGDGLSYKAIIDGSSITKTVQVKTDRLKLPTLLNISFSYDIRLDKDKDAYNHRLTLAGSFTNFAYSANQATVGLEYGFKKFLAFRGGYVFQEGSLSSDLSKRTSAFTGLSGGLSLNFTGESGNTIALDYGYRATNPFSGCHSFGIRIGLGTVE